MNFLSKIDNNRDQNFGSKVNNLCKLFEIGLAVPDGFILDSDFLVCRETLTDAVEEIGGFPVAVRSSSAFEDLEGLSFSSPKLFEQVVFNLSTDENYAKKARLTECFKCGIAAGQTKTVHAKLKTDQLLELNFKSKEWNEILLGNTVSFLHPVRDGKNEDGSDFIFEYEVYISDWQVVIHYEDPGDSWVSYDIFEGNLKQLRGYYS